MLEPSTHEPYPERGDLVFPDIDPRVFLVLEKIAGGDVFCRHRGK
jgi:hypothetical protein